MKKTVYFICVALLAIVTASACSKDTSKSIAGTTWTATPGHTRIENGRNVFEYEHTLTFQKSTWSITVNYNPYKGEKSTYTANGVYVYDPPTVMMTNTSTGNISYATVSDNMLKWGEDTYHLSN